MFNSGKHLFFCFALTFGCVSQNLLGQDTLHLNYHHTQMKAHDTTVAKIERWAKSLNGKSVNLKVLAYYHKSEFKPGATARNEDLFLVLNRKARTLITIQSMEAVKGKESQRNRVDIVYTFKDAPVVQNSVAEESKPVKAEPKKPEKQEKPEKPKESKKDNVKEESTARNNQSITPPEQGYTYDTVYVNGEMKLKKVKVKAAAPQKQVVPQKLDPRYDYDTVYVNGEMKIKKRKK